MIFLIALGMATISLLPVLPSTLLGYVLIFISIPLVFIKKIRLPAAFMIGLAFGIMSNNHLAESLWQDEWHGKDIVLSGWITDIPKKDSIKTRFSLDIDKAVLSDSNTPIPIKKITVSWRYADKTIIPGNYYTFKTRLKKPVGSRNPGLFNYHTWALSSGIDAVGYIKEYIQHSPQLDKVWNIDRERQKILKILDKISHDYKLKHNGSMRALLIGDKSAISEDQWHLLKATGVVHMMVISGLHIGLVAILGFLLGSGIGRFTQFILPILTARQIGGIFAICLSLSYAALAGFSLPTQRASIMVVSLFLGMIFNLNISLFTRLSLGLLGILVIQPLALYQTSFWLSFGAVSILLAYFSGSKNTSYFVAILKTQWALFIGFSILLIISFSQFSILAPIANLFVLWAVSLLVIPAIIISGFSIIAGYPLNFLLVLSDYTLEYIFRFLDFLYIDQALMQVQAPTWTILLASLCAFIILLPFASWWRYIVLIGLLPVFFYSPQKQDDLSIRMFDVGQGLSVLIRTPNHTLVYDVGKRFSAKFDYGKHVVATYLKMHKLNSIDTLILSHNDNDHIGGAKGFMEFISPTRILSGQQISDIDTKLCNAGDSWVWDGVVFTFLHPNKQRTGLKQDNDFSCVLSIRNQSGSILITGDITHRVERKIMHNLAQFDIVVAPHHGSKSSSSEGFVQSSHPKFTLISSGFKNQYKHPHADVIRRYNSIQSKIFNTAQYGSIKIALNGDKYTIEDTLSSYLPWWQK